VEDVDPRNFTANFYHLKVENRIFYNNLIFQPAYEEKRSNWGANFGFVGKPIPTFLIAVH